jgi:hypothetical protein
MDDNRSLTWGERIEKEFKDFIGRLLEAHSYDFMKEKILFSRKTLERTLTKFCHIIAEELDCDSCTIQLQMYDSKMMNKELLNLIIDHFKKTTLNYTNMGETELHPILEKCVESGIDSLERKELDKLETSLERFIKYRIDLLKSPLTFPYWAQDYKKGSASLVTANPNSPWLPILKDKKNKLKYISLQTGISKDIYQENVARVRDRLSIRETRNFRKLGEADMLVWKNIGWKYVFKDYYGVPLRIHSGGEVIGILKAENKKTHWKDDKEDIIDKFPKRTNPDNLIKKIFKKIIQKYNGKDFGSLQVSLLSLFYLKNDLEKGLENHSKRDKGQKQLNIDVFDKLLFIPYPDHIIKVLERIKERIQEDLAITSENKIEDPIEFLKKKISGNGEEAKKIFDKRKLLCDILRDFIFAFYCDDIEIKKLEDELRAIVEENTKNDYSRFKSLLLGIVKKFKSKMKEVKKKKITSLKPVGNERPPIQLFTKNLEDEKRLWGLLEESKDLKKLRHKVEQLYKAFIDGICKSGYIYGEKKEGKDKVNLEFKIDINQIQKQLNGEINGDINIDSRIENWQSEKSKLPHFHFKLSLSENSKKQDKEEKVELYIVIPPTRPEIDRGLVPDSNYKMVNDIWYNDKETLSDFCDHRKDLEKSVKKFGGEYIFLQDSTTVTDLMLDRLGARIQAFADALPIEPFSPEDTYKLKWAAYEIGKLMEREISYRANRHDDPIPLTAMEFYRIPISDLSFVDDLRTRRINLERIADNIDVYLKNIIFDMEMTDEVDYSSRIKGYRSMFLRIGERFEGYVRGNIALWVFLLSLTVEGKKNKFLERIKINKKEGEDFYNNLMNFRDNVKEWLGESSSEIDACCKKEVQKDLAIDIYGDLKFDSPPFLDYRNIETIHEGKTLLEKIKIIIENIQEKKPASEEKMEYIKKAKEAEEYLTKFKEILETIFLEEEELRNVENKIDQLKKLEEQVEFIDEVESIASILFKLELEYNKKSLVTLKQRIKEIKEDKTSSKEGPEQFKQFAQEIIKTQSNPIKTIIDFYNLLHTLENYLENFEKSNGNNPGIESYNSITNRINNAIEKLSSLIKNDSHQEELIKAFNLIRENIEKEGFKGKYFNRIDNQTKIDDYFGDNQELFDDLLIRNYSYFIRDSLSLLIQIGNLLKTLHTIDDYIKFKKFYRKCRELREFLCSSPQQLESKEKYHLEKIFGIGKDSDKKEGEWKKIKEFINKYNTRSAFGGDNKEYLQLNYKSIYKRIRMLNNILHRQIPSALLDWELSRYDLYGSRMNCLYKNQVFVLYEKIWNKGDPFFIYEPQAEKFEDYYIPNKEINTNKYRQRWLCLRTSFLQGEYNACQISTLIDPKTVGFGYWEKIESYNLKCVQYLLGEIFNEFESTAAEKYRNYSWHRHLISESYSKWYKNSADLFQWEFQKPERDQKETKWFGSFLFASVINLLMMMVSSMIDYRNKDKGKNSHNVKNRYDFQKYTIEKIVKEMEKDINKNNLFFKIIDNICKVIEESGVEYSRKIKKSFMNSKLFSEIQFKCTCKNALKPEVKKQKQKECKYLVVCEGKNGKADECDIYIMASNLVNNITRNSLNPRDEKIFKKIEANMKREKEFFAELEMEKNIKGFQIPLFFVEESQRDSHGCKNIDYIEKLPNKLKDQLQGEKGSNIPVRSWAFIYHVLKRIRREQKSYLFDRGEKGKYYSGLWIRDKREVLERIKNYVLLFSKKYVENQKEHFHGWNAHDLYYYLKSLIPMEIQFRTELADTFAVQYHDSIYKVQPPPGTDFPHAMIKNAGEALDKIDREIEIDYEDYILKYHHRVEEEEEEEED